MKRLEIDIGTGLHAAFVADECEPRVTLVVNHIEIDLHALLAALPMARGFYTLDEDGVRSTVRMVRLDEHDRHRLDMLRAELLASRS